MPEMRTVSESANSAATVSPSEDEIAAVAYQLWLERGCPSGSDQEDWFLAEAAIKNAAVGRCEDLPKILAEFPWEGRWELWEREWVSARWVWDVPSSRVGGSNRACLAGKMSEYKSVHALARF